MSFLVESGQRMHSYLMCAQLFLPHPFVQCPSTPRPAAAGKLCQLARNDPRIGWGSTCATHTESVTSRRLRSSNARPRPRPAAAGKMCQLENGQPSIQQKLFL